MKGIKFNKKLIFIFILILGIGTTLAYFTSNVTIPNIFTTEKYETTTTEQFNSPSDWIPGDVTPKAIVTTNSSNTPIRVRVKVDEEWIDKNDNSLSLEENGIKAAILDLDNRVDWIYEDGYYYYMNDVEPGEDAPSFIKSVTFNKEIVGEYICTTQNNIEQCDSAGETYQDANYELNITVETTQADNYMDAWNLEHTPRRVDPTYCTYEGELDVGTTYVNGQYTYVYKQKLYNIRRELTDMEEDGWGVYLTDNSSTDPVTSTLCTYINDKPVIATSYMFYNSKASSIDTSSFDTREIKYMNQMFFYYQSGNIDVENFETYNVTNMEAMFRLANGNGLDVSGFDTSNVTNMGYLFGNLKNNPKIDVTHFDTSNVVSMRYLFLGFDGQLEGAELLNTENVTDMSGMFSGFKLDEIDFTNYDTSNVENMSSLFSSFSGRVIGLESLDTSNVVNMNAMFSNSNITNFDISNLDTSNVENMSGMFRGSKYSSLDISNFDTSNVTNMSSMFYSSTATTIDVSGIDTSKVTTMSNMFCSAHNLEEIIGIEDFDTSRVTSFREMFYGENKLTRLDLKKWNTQSTDVSGISGMFRDCRLLEYLDIRNFDTSNVISYYNFLCNLFSLTYLNMSNLDSQNVESFYYFTTNMKSIKEHDFSNLKTSKVTTMAYLFHWHYALEKLYISDLWDTSSLTDTAYMFQGASLLTGDINNRYTMKPRINNLAISDTSTRTIHVGESITIPSVTATYTDSSIVVKNSEDLIWKSSNLDVAKANLGVVKGISPGNATITIKSGIVETTFNVVVIE